TQFQEDEADEPSTSTRMADRELDSALLDTVAALKYAPGMRSFQLIATTYLKALWQTKGVNAPRDDVDLAFQLAQQNELSAAAAIARMAARGLGGPELATKVRLLQDLEEEQARLSLGNDPLRTDADKVLARMKKITRERAQIEAEIAKKFPRYYEQ